MVIDVENVVWLDFIVEKINRKHGVIESEVIELFQSKLKKVKWVEKGHVKGEDVYSVTGQTDSGRYIIVFFIYKPDKTIIPLSARTMDEKEKRRYGKK
jgi:uncharacterized DUF497 family protein